MDESLERYLDNGIKNISNDAVDVLMDNQKEQDFAFSFIKNSMVAKDLRKKHSDNGEHIPPFIICSITQLCNLNCQGCYEAVNAEVRNSDDDIMSAGKWDEIFCEAETLGIMFALLAGGEPLLRKDVINIAASHKKLIFPIFTNGILINNDMLCFFDKNRNIIPIISIEGGQKTTDARRGCGVYDTLKDVMRGMQKMKIIFGASVTVTSKNMDEVSLESYIDDLESKGCRVIFYIEYVPVKKTDKDLALNEHQRRVFMEKTHTRKTGHPGIMIMNFPGDELKSGGCLAAGRGFFHINAFGGAEPCPFSPYSDVNVKASGILGAMKSPLFKRLAQDDILSKSHDGGCVLFEHEEKVREYAKMG